MDQNTPTSYGPLLTYSDKTRREDYAKRGKKKVKKTKKPLKKNVKKNTYGY